MENRHAADLKYFTQTTKIASSPESPPPHPFQLPFSSHRKNPSSSQYSPNSKGIDPSFVHLNQHSIPPTESKSSFSRNSKYSSLTYSSVSYDNSNYYNKSPQCKYHSKSARPLSYSGDSSIIADNGAHGFASLPLYSEHPDNQTPSTDNQAVQSLDSNIKVYGASSDCKLEEFNLAIPESTVKTRREINFSLDDPNSINSKSTSLTTEVFASLTRDLNINPSGDYSSMSSESGSSDFFNEEFPPDLVSPAPYSPLSVELPKSPTKTTNSPTLLRKRVQSAINITPTPAEVASTSYRASGGRHSSSGTKTHKKPSTFFGYKHLSTKSPKTTSSPSLPVKKYKTKNQPRKHNMFNRLKSYEGPSSYLLNSKRDDSSSKKSSSSPTRELPISFSTSSYGRSSSSHFSSSSYSSSSTPSSPVKKSQGFADLLTCPVCLEDYQVEGPRGREPLFLSCHHSICRACLPKLTRSSSGKYSSHSKDGNELSCPECRVVTQIPATGLTQNFYLVSLIGSRSKSTKEPSSRLRMWCKECGTIALETCTSHQVTHLSPVLGDYASTYSTSKRHLVKYLSKRAKHKGEEAREIKSAVEQLDSAASSVRKRLMAQLDYATLTQATATSLLQEVQHMCRRVDLDDKIDLPSSEGSSSKKISQGSLGAEVMNSLLRENLFRDSTRSSDRSSEGSSRGTDTANSPSGSSSSSRNSPTFERQSSFDQMTSYEQEAKIMVLKECLNTMESMQETLNQEEMANREKLSRSKSSGDNTSKDALSEMFNNALRVVS